MNLGEDLECDNNGVVFGVDTGRLVAKFSHAQEAKSFCELLQNMQQLEKAYKNATKNLYCDICNCEFKDCKC